MRLLLGTLVALLALNLAPVALAAGGPGVPADDPTPVVESTASPQPTPTHVENGEIVIDPTFIATPTSAGEVADATGRPQATPPATDTNSAATTSGTGLQVLLVLGVAGSFLALALARVRPRARH